MGSSPAAPGLHHQPGFGRGNRSGGVTAARSRRSGMASPLLGFDARHRQNLRVLTRSSDSRFSGVCRRNANGNPRRTNVRGDFDWILTFAAIWIVGGLAVAVDSFL